MQSVTGAIRRGTHHTDVEGPWGEIVYHQRIQILPAGFAANRHVALGHPHAITLNLYLHGDAAGNSVTVIARLQQRRHAKGKTQAVDIGGCDSAGERCTVLDFSVHRDFYA